MSNPACVCLVLGVIGLCALSDMAVHNTFQVTVGGYVGRSGLGSELKTLSCPEFMSRLICSWRWQISNK